MIRHIHCVVMAVALAAPAAALTVGASAAAEGASPVKPAKATPKVKRQRWPVRRPKLSSGLPPRQDIKLVEGERLAFKVRMFGADAGEVVLAIGQRTEVGGRTLLPLAGFVRGSDFLSKFYPVNDKLVVLVDEKTFLPVKADLYARENGNVVDYHTTFDQRTGLISQVRDKPKSKETVARNFTTAGPVYETLDSAYGARLLDLQLGATFQFMAWTNTRERLITVKVAAVEKIWTEAFGFREAYRLEMSGQVTGGFIKRSVLSEAPKKGTMWISADDERIPLKVVMPTKLGDAEGLLIKRYIDHSAL